MDTFLLDLKLALRGLLRAPGFALTALLTLALGIGANAAMFSLVDQTLLRPLPYKEPERLMVIYATNPGAGWMHNNVSAPNYLDIQRGVTAFESIAGVTGTSTNLSGDGQPAFLNGGRVSAGFFELLGVRPQLGRTFTKEEDLQEGPRVVLLSDELWRSRYGADPSVVGRSVRLDGLDTQVIGVLPKGFNFPLRVSRAQYFVPMAFTKQNLQGRGNHFFNAIGRLKPGVTPAAGAADIRRLSEALAASYPDNNLGWSGDAKPLAGEVVRFSRPVLLSLLAVVALVLLIACANVASLLLARSLGRRREVAIRAALGADRNRILRQLLTESVLLALLGGLGGFFLSHILLAGLQAVVPLPRGVQPHLDGATLAFTFGLSLVTGLVFGGLPAWQATRLDLNSTLRDESKTTASGSTHRLRSLLVVAEVAMATTLLIAAGLMLRNLWRLQKTPMGFRSEGLLTASVVLPSAKYSNEAAFQAFSQGMKQRLEASPGVVSAGISDSMPMGDNENDSSYDPEGMPAPKGKFYDAWVHIVTPDYIRTMGAPLMTGRDFRIGDHDVCIVNESLARRHWGGLDVVGKRLSMEGPGGPWISIIGVAGDIQQEAPGAEQRPQIYFPAEANPYGAATQDIVIRSQGDPMALRGTVLEALRQIDPEISPSRILPMDGMLSKALEQQRFMGLLFAVFAGVALLLSSVGIFGLMSFVARQRTREIGIRMALGASVQDVLKLIVGQGAQLVLAGTGIGLLAAGVLVRVMAAQAQAISASEMGAYVGARALMEANPGTYAEVTLLLGAVALLACLLPALRAARVDPMIALRSE